MIEVAITPQMLASARNWSAALGTLHNSITSGDGNMAGFVGKYMVADYLKTGLHKTYDYDIIHAGKRLLVKSKRCTSKPFPNYECSIAAFNPNQKCDYFVFTRVLNDLSRGWILGVMSPLEYFETCTKYETGDHDPQNNFTFHCRTFNLPIRRLHPLEDLQPVAVKPASGGLDAFM